MESRAGASRSVAISVALVVGAFAVVVLLARGVKAPQAPASDGETTPASSAQASYEAGYADGTAAGEADARAGRPFDDPKALQQGRVLSRSHSGDQTRYAAGYRKGYGDGWRRTKHLGDTPQ